MSGIRCWTAAVCLLLGTTAAAAGAPRVHRKMQATAYCQRGKSSSGVPVHSGIVAADPRILPKGTLVHVRSPLRHYSGDYVVADTGAAVKGRVLDIYIRDCREARRFGRRRVTVTVLGVRPIEAVAAK